MIETATVVSAEADSAVAGEKLGREIREAFKGAAADAVVVFASARHDYAALLGALARASGTDTIAGSSSAGEFSDAERGEGWVSVLALRADRASMSFSVGVGRKLGRDPASAARQAVHSFKGLHAPSLPYRYALVMTDALAGHADAVVEELSLATGGNYRFFGGGAGDDGRFAKTHVFAGTQAFSDALVALEIQAARPLGIGVSHGWIPASAGFRVTEADGPRLVSLNGAPALQAMQDHAQSTGQVLDLERPLPFFLHNILGIEDDGHYRLRVPLGINPDGSIACAAEVPTGSIVHIMKTSAQSAVVAAEQATRSALAALEGRQPGAALVFDCVATRLRLGKAFNREIEACAALLRPASFIGCNTYGQIARAEGQFSGFHNCTAVVCIIPQ